MATADIEAPAGAEAPQGDSTPKRETATRATDRCSRLTRKKVLVLIALSGLVVVAVIIGITCHYVLGRGSAKGVLDDYSRIPSYEALRPKASVIFNDTTLVECASNCSNHQDQLDCVHIQFCAPEGSLIGQCKLFPGQGRVHTVFSETCNFYTRGNPENAGIPHSGASSLKTGLPKWLLFVLFLLAVHVFSNA